MSAAPEPEQSLVPRPGELSTEPRQSYVLSAATRISASPGAENAAALLRDRLGAATGFPFPPPGDNDGPDTTLILLRIDRESDVALEGYRLASDPSGVAITASDAAGVFYGAQTLLQLLPCDIHRSAPASDATWRLPSAQITDQPRFGWRGCMLDVARHFMPKREVLRFIDLLAMHKLNVLHLHLTDDQGWRVEIKRYPKLTEVGAWRHESQVGPTRPPAFDGRPHGGYYTQEDIREIVSYAASRHITVVPEIDVPGHSQAAIAAYPYLGEGEPVDVGREWGIIDRVLNVSDATLEFYRGVFDEVMELFPSSYICVGGDECPKQQWRASATAQQRIREEGLAGEDELQSWFIRQFAEYFAQHGRRLLGWDEILEGGLPRGATVASWRGTQGGIAAARAGHDVVMCPTDTNYLDYRQSDSPEEPMPVGPVLTLADVYTSEPIPPELAATGGEYVRGAQVNVWTEHMDTPRAVDYMTFPRLSAFSEVVWSAGERDYAEFLPRLEQHLARLDAAGVEYRPLGGPHPWQQRPALG